MDMERVAAEAVNNFYNIEHGNDTICKTATKLPSPARNPSPC
jgi:hypothetical protein